MERVAPAPFRLGHAGRHRGAGRTPGEPILQQQPRRLRGIEGGRRVRFAASRLDAARGCARVPRGALRVLGDAPGYNGDRPCDCAEPHRSRNGRGGGYAAAREPGARTRHGLQAVFEPGEWTLAGRRHRVSMGGSWELAGVRNRWSAPAGVNLITAKGAPAFVVVFTGGPESRARIQSAAAYVQDTITITPWLTADAGAAGDFAHGDGIAWNSLSGRVGLALTPSRG